VIMAITTTKLADGKVVAKVVSDLDTMEFAADFKEALQRLYDEGESEVVLDLSQVKMINSNGIGKILMFHKRFADRGGQIEAVKVKYKNKRITTPDFKPGKIEIEVGECNKLLGLNLSAQELKAALEKRRYSIEIKHSRLLIGFPAYRQDIMHESDIAEDVIISYGFNKIDPDPLKIITKGGLSKDQGFVEAVTDIMIGAGFQEILSYTLTNNQNLHEKMNTSGQIPP